MLTVTQSVASTDEHGIGAVLQDCQAGAPEARNGGRSSTLVLKRFLGDRLKGPWNDGGMKVQSTQSCHCSPPWVRTASLLHQESMQSAQGLAGLEAGAGSAHEQGPVSYRPCQAWPACV